jgi:UDP:flavonoid glycosyltransferase YjiC (YdhE family)
MRVAVVAGPWPGHVFPAAGLARALAERGHAVLMVTGHQWLQRLGREGFATAELPMVAARGDIGDAGYRLYELQAAMARPLVCELAPWQPDVVVADTLMTVAGYAAELLGLPWAELIPHPLQDPSPHLPCPGTGFDPSRRWLDRGRYSVFRALHARSLRKATVQRRAARRSIGLPDRAAPSVRLIATLPGLELSRPDWPKGAAVVGPLEWDPTDGDLPEPPGEAPLVFLSASTASDQAAALLPVGLAACERLGLRLASTQFSPYDDPLPRWAAVGPGRQGPLLDASSVVVGGAGHGIIAKALCRGLPIIAVPGGGEQYDNAMRVRRAGAGVTLMPPELSAAALTDALLRTLADPSYAAGARRVAASGAGLGPTYAAQLLERRFPSRRPPATPAGRPRAVREG